MNNKLRRIKIPQRKFISLIKYTTVRFEFHRIAAIVYIKHYVYS